MGGKSRKKTERFRRLAQAGNAAKELKALQRKAENPQSNGCSCFCLRPPPSRDSAQEEPITIKTRINVPDAPYSGPFPIHVISASSPDTHYLFSFEDCEIYPEPDVEVKVETPEIYPDTQNLDEIPDADDSQCPAAHLCLVCSSACQSKSRNSVTEPIGSLILFLLEKLIPVDNFGNREPSEKFLSTCANICSKCVLLVQEAFITRKQIKQLEERTSDIITELYSTLSKKESTDETITCDLYQSIRNNCHSPSGVDNDDSCSEKSDNDSNFDHKSKRKRRKLCRKSSLIEESTSTIRQSKRIRSKPHSKRNTQQNSPSEKSDVVIDCSNVLFEDNDDGPPSSTNSISSPINSDPDYLDTLVENNSHDTDESSDMDCPPAPSISVASSKKKILPSASTTNKIIQTNNRTAKSQLDKNVSQLVEKAKRKILPKSSTPDKTLSGKVAQTEGSSQSKRENARAKSIKLCVRPAPAAKVKLEPFLNTGEVLEPLKYPCVICDAQFSNDKEADRHRKNTHPGLSVCFIDNCNQVFYSKDIKEHRIQSHGFHHCLCCRAIASSYSYLVAHYKHYHPTMEIPPPSENDFNPVDVSPLERSENPPAALQLPLKLTPLSKDEILSHPFIKKECINKSTDASKTLNKSPSSNAIGSQKKNDRGKQIQSKSIDLPPPAEKKAVFKCGVCEEKFEDKVTLVTHFQSTHKKKLMFACHICKNKFPSMKDYETHFSTAHSKKSSTMESTITENIPCDIENCSEVFPSTAALTRHKVLLHKEKEAKQQQQLQRLLKCTKCYSRFKTENELKEHQKKHDEPASDNNPQNKFQCTEVGCSRQYDTEAGLKWHKNNIHDNKLYSNIMGPDGKIQRECKQCGKTFRTPSNLQVHIRRHHTLEKRFECNLCDQKFIMKETLTLHIRRAHTGERPNICEICNKGFFTKNKLTQHKQIHTDVRSYLCHICGKAFKTNNNLYIHKMSHDPDRKLKYSPYMPNPNKPKYRRPKGFKGIRGRQRGLIASENGVVEGLPIRADPAQPTAGIDEAAKSNDNEKDSSVTKVSKKSCNEKIESTKDNESKRTEVTIPTLMPVPDSLSVEQFE